MDCVDPILKKICDEITTQEEKKGFFNTLVSNLKANTQLYEWAEEQLSHKVYGEKFIKNLTNNSELFSTIRETFNVAEVYRKKCNNSAESMMMEAEKCLFKNEFDKCKQYCSRALLRVDKKLESGNYLFQKALLMRCQCLIKSKRIDLAKKDIDLAIRCGSIDESLQTVFKKALQSLKELKNETENKCEKVRNTQPPLGISSYIDLTETNEMGRYYVASKDISIGENLIIEKPYSSYLTQSSFGTHCHHCFIRLEAPIGCPDCSLVAFCGENCLTEALNTYHKYECKYMDLFIGSGMAILCFVALRIVTQVGLEDALNIYKKYVIKEENDIKIKSHATYDHESFFKLCTHEEQRCTQDYVGRTLMTFFMLQCLKHSSFFKDYKSTSVTSSTALTTEEITVWSLLLQSLQLLQFNAHQIMDSTNTKEIGFGLFPKTSMMNHQCSPNVNRIFYEKYMIIQANEPIRKGVMIGDSYGPQWGRSLKGGSGQNRNERRRILSSRYWFICKCITCVQNWPIPPPEIPLIKCSNDFCNGHITGDDNLKCNICKTKISKECFVNIQQQLKDLIDNIKEATGIKNSEVKKTTLLTYLDKYWEYTRMPCPAVIKSEDVLRLLFTKSITADTLVLK